MACLAGRSACPRRHADLADSLTTTPRRCMQVQPPATPGTPGETLDTSTSSHVPGTPASGPKSDMGGFNVASIDTTWSALGVSFLLSFAASGAVAVVEVRTYHTVTRLLTLTPYRSPLAVLVTWPQNTVGERIWPQWLLHATTVV